MTSKLEIELLTAIKDAAARYVENDDEMNGERYQILCAQVAAYRGQIEQPTREQKKAKCICAKVRMYPDENVFATDCPVHGGDKGRQE